jgi:hypothetical protein
MASKVGLSIGKTRVPNEDYEEYCIIDKDGEEYHFDIVQYITDTTSFTTPKIWLQNVLSLMEKRKKFLSSKEEKDYANKVFVSIEDSLKSGNCVPGTMGMVRLIKIDPNKIGGIRGDQLLSARNDKYTRRAVREAICRVGLIAR